MIFAFISFLPTSIYYVMGILSDTGFLREQAKQSFLPHLLLYPYFWKDWFVMIGRVTGYISFIVALVGLFMIQKGMPRALLFGLWIGYFVFGLFFTNHIHTHEYYHLQFIPVVAFSIGTIGIRTINFSFSLFRSKKFIIVSGIVLLMVIFTIGISFRNIQWRDYKNQIKTVRSVIGINNEFNEFITSDFEKEVRSAEEIGEIVKHGSENVFLTTYFGRAIAYHGEFSGLPWPTRASLSERRDRGLKQLRKEELFNPRYLTIRTHGKYIKYSPDFFIVKDFEEFQAQTDLKEFLESNFPLIAQSDDYLIFDLRSMSGKIG
jgi:hypothetical protein